MMNKYDSSDEFSAEEEELFDKQFNRSKYEEEQREKEEKQRKEGQERELDRQRKEKQNLIGKLKSSLKKCEILPEVFEKNIDKFKELCSTSFDDKFSGFCATNIVHNINPECIRELERDTRMTAMDNKSFDEYDDINTTFHKDNGKHKTFNNKDYVKRMNVKSMEMNSSSIADNLKNDTVGIIFSNLYTSTYNHKGDALEFIYTIYHKDVE